jgi:DNA-binding SARP family transcriptional activator
LARRRANDRDGHRRAARSKEAATASAGPAAAEVGAAGDAAEPIAYPRLAPRLLGVATPLVWLAGLAGSDRRALLAACRCRLGLRGAALAPALADDARALRVEVSKLRAAGAERFFADDWPAAALSAALRWLHPGETLVAAAGPRGDALDDETRARATVIGAHELLWTPEEVGRALSRRRIAAIEATAWHRYSDGWPRVLELALGPGVSCAGPPDEKAERALARSPEIRAFLRDRVLGGLAASDLARLRRIAATEIAATEIAATEPPGLLETEDEARARLRVPAAAWRELVERRQLLLPLRDGFRLPRPLALHLRDEPRGREPGTGAARERSEIREIRVRVLGPPRIEAATAGGRVEELAWPFRRVLHLLALLAITPEGCTQERVLEALWPESGAAAARAGLHPTVSHLRRVLAAGEGPGSPVLLQGGVYRLNPDWSFAIDARRFEELTVAPDASDASDDRLARLEEAWRLYRGPLLEGMPEAWALEPRRRLEQRHRLVLSELAEIYGRVERLEEAEDCLRTLLAADPLREDVHLRLMLLHARRGRTDLVRRQYERLCGLLARELGAQPLDATVRAVERLLG